MAASTFDDQAKVLGERRLLSPVDPLPPEFPRLVRAPASPWGCHKWKCQLVPLLPASPVAERPQNIRGARDARRSVDAPAGPERPAPSGTPSSQRLVAPEFGPEPPWAGSAPRIEVIASNPASRWGSNFEKQHHQCACGVACLAALYRNMRDLGFGDVYDGEEMTQARLEDRLFRGPPASKFGATRASFLRGGLTLSQLRELISADLEGRRRRPSTPTGSLNSTEAKQEEKSSVPSSSKSIEAKMNQALPTTVTVVQGKIVKALADVQNARRGELPPSISEEALLSAVTDFETQIRLYGGVIVNYLMASLGQWAGGHFSLVVALGKRATEGNLAGPGDLNQGEQYYVAMLDPWPETPVAWVPMRALLRAALGTVDPSSHETRGWILLGKDAEEEGKQRKNFG